MRAWNIVGDHVALRDTLAGFIDNVGLKELFSTKPRDPVAARKPILRHIERTRDQFENGRTRVANRWWSTSNKVVAFAPTLNDVPLLINAQTTNYIPEERFVEFLHAFREAVEQGEFDKEIEQIECGNGNAGSSVEVRMPARRQVSEAGRENMRRAAQARAARQREAREKGGA